MKIVSLAPSNTEILYAIGAGDQVVATTALCDHPGEARQKPSVGGWTNPRVDRLEELEPDLVIASDDLQDDAVGRVRDAGFEVLQLKPHTLEEVFESISEIGERVDRKEEAGKLVEDMRNRMDEINLEGSPRIYCEEWMDPPMVSGNWIPGLVKAIGGEYFIDEGERSREFELEKLKKFDPEYILLNVCGAGENLDPEEVLRRDDWQSITAVEEENVDVVDDALLNRPGPRLVEAAKEIKKLVDE